jgi:MoaA/NifB/PqqE/SkfB family radical SAM enzyme
VNTLNQKNIQCAIAETLSIADKNFPVFHKPYQLELMSDPEGFTRSYRKCYAYHFEWHLFENGDVMLCGPLRLQLGNIYDHSLSDLWNSDNYRALVQAIDIEACYRGCRAHQLNEILWDLENPQQENHINFI